MTRLMLAPADARALTGYMSAAQQEDFLRRKYDLRGETQYRAFLQNNAPAIANDVRFLTTETPPLVMPPYEQ